MWCSYTFTMEIIKSVAQTIHSWISYLNTHSYTLLILTLVLMMVWYPFIAGIDSAWFWIHLLMSFIIATGFYTVSRHNSYVRETFFLWMFALIFSWLDFVVFGNQIISLLYYTTWLFFLGYLTSSLVISLHNDDKVNAHLILWSIAWYMLLWLMWAFVFAIIEILVPWSFSGISVEFQGFTEYLYYSFVTLTTLWYWDVVPINTYAQSWSVLFSVAWQMYLMVFIGVIVWKYVMKWSEIL